MAESLSSLDNAPSGPNIGIIPGNSGDAEINRFIATPGFLSAETKRTASRVLTPIVALAAMTAAALADAPSPTRLSESQLDTITAGLNIDTPNLLIQTGCNYCSDLRTDTVFGSTASGGAFHSNAPNPTDTSGWVAGYAGPLGLLGVGAAGGGGYNRFNTSATTHSNGAYSNGTVWNGQGVAVSFRGPLGILSVGAAADVGSSSVGFSGSGVDSTAANSSALSLNNVGGTLNIPVGGGKEASLSLKAGIGVPGL